MTDWRQIAERAQNLLVRGEPETVAAELFAAWQADADNAELANLYACACFHAGRLEEAAQILDVLLEQTPDNPRFLNNRGYLHLANGENEAALRLLERAQALAPDDAEIIANLGIALSRRQRLVEALALFDRAIALAPTAANYNNRGVILRQCGRLAAAAADFRAALRIDPGDSRAANNLGCVARALGNRDEALAAFRQAVAGDGRNAVARRNLAVLWAEMGDLAAADREYAALLEVADEGRLAEEARTWLARHAHRAKALKNEPA